MFIFALGLWDGLRLGLELELGLGLVLGLGLGVYILLQTFLKKLYKMATSLLLKNDVIGSHILSMALRGGACRSNNMQSHDSNYTTVLQDRMPKIILRIKWYSALQLG